MNAATRDAPKRRDRLDRRLVSAGLVESRVKAQALVMAGRVKVDGQPAHKPGAQVNDSAALEVDPGPRHVGRGALKLVGALDAFAIATQGRVAIDVGASTGGFTEVLLERGARRVYAVDVGRAQLHDRMRRDGRVVVLERVNARYLTRQIIPEACDLLVMDVSFISVLKIFPALPNIMSPEFDAAILVKPQFELSKRDVGRGGVVRSAECHARALLGVADSARKEHGFSVMDACASPIAGAVGNREFFLHLRHGGAPGLTGDVLCARIRAATASPMQSQPPETGT